MRARWGFAVLGAGLLLVLGAIFFVPAAHAAACLSNATGNWNAAGTWTSCGGTYPQSGDTATVRNAHTVTVNGTFTVAGVTVTAPTSNATTVLGIGDGSLTVTGSVTVTGGTGQKKASLTFNTGTLKVGGSLTDSGATVLTWGTGTVEYNGTGAQTVTVYNYYNLTINKSAGTATTGGNITIGNNLTLTSGTLNIGANSINRGAAGGALTISAGAALQIAASYFPTNYNTVSLDTSSTVEYNPAFNIVVPAPGGGANYGNLLLSTSGNRAFNAAMTIAGNLTATGTVALAMNAGITVNGTLNLGPGTSMDAKLYSHTFNGNFTNNGTFTPSTSTITFSGTSAQAITGVATSFYNVVFNNPAGVTTSVDLSVGGNFTNTAGFGAGTTTTTLNGTAAQTISGVTAFYNLTMNNTAGTTSAVTINNDVTVSNTLTFTSGILSTGTNTLIFSSTASCGVTGAGSGKYVIGKLRKSFTATQTTCDFEVGDSHVTTHYSPLNVSFSSVTNPGALTVSVSGGSGTSATADDHPQISSSSIDSLNSVDRYWMLVPVPSSGGLAFSNATLTFTYLNLATYIDHDNTANVGSYIIQRFEVSDANCYPSEAGYTGSGSWNNTTATGTQTVTQAAATNISTFGSNCSHFAIGKGTVSGFTREPQWIYQRELYY